MQRRSRALERMGKFWPRAFGVLQLSTNWSEVYRLVLQTKEKKVEEHLKLVFLHYSFSFLTTVYTVNAKQSTF